MRNRLWWFSVWIGLMGFNGVYAKAPEVIPLSPAGYTTLVKQHRGHIVVVNIWSTFCEPCRKEFPDFLWAYKHFEGQNVDFIFISVDWPEDKRKVIKFLEEQDVHFRTYIKDGKDMEFIEAVSPRWSGAIPATFIYDEKGQIRISHEGLLNRHKLEMAIMKLLKDSSIEK